MYLKHLKLTVFGAEFYSYHSSLRLWNTVYILSFKDANNVLLYNPYCFLAIFCLLRITKFLILCYFHWFVKKKKLFYIDTCAFFFLVFYFSVLKMSPRLPIIIFLTPPGIVIKIRTKWKTINNSWEGIMLHTMTAIFITVINRARCSCLDNLNLLYKNSSILKCREITKLKI